MNTNSMRCSHTNAMSQVVVVGRCTFQEILINTGSTTTTTTLAGILLYVGEIINSVKMIIIKKLEFAL